MKIQETSYFNQKFQINVETYKGARFDRKAFVFPGQGSSTPGMYKVELKKHPEFQELFALADQFSEAKGLGKVSDYINQHDAIGKDQLPFIRNMALFTSQVALFRYLERIKVKSDVLTAHSFGEYAVLTCSGALDFPSMLEVVYQRDVFSPAVNEVGSLVALSSSVEEFKKLQVPCDYVIANLNSPQQIVLAVEQGKLKVLSEFLKKNRIAARPMDSVGRPYHSKWMNSAQEKFKNWLSSQNFKLSPLTTAVLSSVNRQVYPKGHQFSQDELKQLLAEQLIQPVLFNEQSAALAKMGIHSFIELGLSSFCVGFIKANVEEHDMTSFSVSRFLSSGADKKNSKSTFSIDTKNNKYFKMVSRYIGDITGYDIKDIMVGDSFQEDLQIDSIKKAEIVFRVLEESRLTVGEGVSISQLHAVGDVVEYLERIANTQTTEAKKVNKEFHLLTREWVPAPLPVSPSANLREDQIIPLILSYQQALPVQSLIEQLHAGSGSERKILCITIQDAPPDFEGCTWLGKTLKDFADLIERSPLTSKELKIVLLANHSHAFFLGLKAFFKSLQNETRKFTFKSILNSDSLEQKLLIEKELGDIAAFDVRYCGGQRWTVHFKQVQNDQTVKDAVIFSVGGSKGILNAVYQSFSDRQNCQLFMTGRSPADNPQVVAALKKLRKSFKSVTYFQADAGNKASLQEAVNKAAATYGKIDFFINSAGLEISKKLIEQNTQEVQGQLESKFDSLKNLMELQKQHPQAQLITFSSVVAQFGNDGQTIYSFANGYLDAFEKCRHIHWPPMDGIGMTENPGILQRLRSMGVALMPEKDASKLFALSLNMKNPVSDLFYLDLKDVYLYEFPLRNAMTDRRVLGDLSDPTRLISAKSYDLKNDSYLRDHHIESTSVVAAATGVAAFMTFGSYFFKAVPTIENFEIKNMILVNDRENFCAFQPEFISAKELQIKLISQVEHFAATLRAINEFPSQEKMTMFKGTQCIDMDSFYSVRSIDYGPKFQVIEQAFYDSQKNVVAIGKKNVPYLTGLALNDYVSYLVELGFQAIYLKNVLLGKGLGIPLRIKKIKPENFQISEDVYAVPSAYSEGSDDKMIFGGAKIYNGKGELILDIEGVEMSTIRLYEAPPFGATNKEWEFRGL